MLVLRCLIGILVGTSMCQAFFRIAYPKDFQIAFKHLRDFRYNNEVTLDTYPILSRRRGQMRKGLTTRDCPAHLTRGPAPPPSSVYPIGEMSFSVPTPTAAGVRKRRVHAKCGLLRGLDDFEQLPPTLVQSGRSDPGVEELWLSWSRLRATCALTTDLDGLPDNLGETQVRVSSVYMVVKREEESGGVVRIEVAPSRDAKVEAGLGSLSKDERDAIRVELRTNILCVVNSRVMDSLKEFVREGLAQKDTEFMSKLTHV